MKTVMIILGLAILAILSACSGGYVSTNSYPYNSGYSGYYYYNTPGFYGTYPGYYTPYPSYNYPPRYYESESDNYSRGNYNGDYYRGGGSY